MTPAMAPERAKEIAAGFDLRALPPDFYANPYPVYALLRETEPVKRMPDGSYFLTRYADLVNVYRDAQAFSSDKKVEFTPKYGAGSALLEHHTTSLVFNDPPLHTRVRKLIMGALTRRAIADMEPAGALTASHPQASEHHDHRRQGGEHVDDHGQRHGRECALRQRVVATSLPNRGRPGSLTLTCGIGVRSGLRGRRLDPLQLTCEPVQQGVHLGHPVAPEGQGEAHLAHVLGIQRTLGDQRVGAVVVRLGHRGAAPGGQRGHAAHDQDDENREEPHHGRLTATPSLPPSAGPPRRGRR